MTQLVLDIAGRGDRVCNLVAAIIPGNVDANDETPA